MHVAAFEMTQGICPHTRMGDAVRLSTTVVPGSQPPIMAYLWTAGTIQWAVEAHIKYYNHWLDCECSWRVAVSEIGSYAIQMEIGCVNGSPLGGANL